ncbi:MULTISPECIES: guanylate kinase [unclassified Fusibacter]|uniref:guanylate kinase n=1 Tax=unclassified Fusibacter TaxID=2624464 RepID=UPI00101275FC|nr:MULTISPECIES: guanylate kinase [unclassified Fusibacter]MCK8058047.1 guanylate kinase [Fusibacter sp. A2]NPE20629.1 guanylate kinase [Fusibacter sp. A1]RXV62836.1 guanylate kinase [Fusibacter sp. A1]
MRDKMIRRGLLLVVSGPSGAGKGTICKALLERHPEINISVSATTRQPRNGEVDGINYHFLTKDDFVEKLSEDGFFEHAQVYDNYYGTPKKFVIDKLAAGEDVLLEIDIQGAMQVRDKYPEGIYLFVLPPSMSELKNRIIKRGSETQESLEKRFSSAFKEIDFIKKYDYYIINDDLERAVTTLENIIHAEKHRVVEDMANIIAGIKEI